eukprot:6760535-Prymnesium_polylepis.1
MAAPRLNMSAFYANGFAIVPGVFDPAEVDHMRAQVLRHSALGLPSMSGRTIVDFLAKDEFKALHHLRTAPKLLGALSKIFGGHNFRYCGHNDIGIDRLVGWHKDKLN